MFTDLIVVNRSAHPLSLDFFQECYGSQDRKPFARTENCQPDWMHRIRINWEVSFRIIGSDDCYGDLYDLSALFRPYRSYHIVFPNGKVCVDQSDHCRGRQVRFERFNSSLFSGIQLFRGSSCIAEQNFTTDYLSFELNRFIHFNYSNSVHEGSQSFDLTGIRTIYLQPSNNGELVVQKKVWW